MSAKGHTTITDWTKAFVIERDGSRCQYCTRTLEFSAVTFDHVVPRSRGGSGADTNLVVACRPCNSSKGVRAAPYPWVAERV